MMETTLTGKTPDIAEENIKKLKQIFPEVFTEDKVDFKKLKQILGEYVEDNDERYNFTWNGKGRALRLSQTSSLGTLRPCKEESKNWDTTQNLYIEGDNLEVLKLLQKSYYGKIKMIYIDPPYNTGKDFVYKDDFHDSIDNYKRITGQVDGDGKPISTNRETSGRYHTDWLNMMYPRLRLARNLLTDDGVVFISIDDNEVHNLRKICDEVFGEENFIAQLVWEKKKKGSFLSNSITNIKEYVIVFCKTLSAFNGLIGEINDSVETYPCINAVNKREIRVIPKGIESKYKEANYFLPKGHEISDTTMNMVLHSDMVIKNGILAEDLVIEGNWRYSQETMTEYAKKKELYITRDLYLRRIVADERQKTLKDILPRVGENPDISYNMPININNLFESGWGSNEDADDELRLLMNVQKLLEYPKPVRLIEKLIASFRENDFIILDFFAGSATTAHAVMKLNAEDGGNRKFIMVQLPEPLDENSEAYKAGYMNISEIGKERIRRAGEKIKEEKGLEAQNLDIGFKVFKLDTSNIRKWQPDYDNLEQSLLDYVDNFVEDRTELDVIYEIMLKYGLDLTYPVDEFAIAGRKVYSISFGMLMICLDDEITTEVAKGILAKIKELSPESSRVVFKDNGFKTDSNKTNIKETFKAGGIEEFITI